MISTMRLVLLGAIAATLVACGTTTGAAPTPDGSTADLTVTSVDMAFETDTITLEAGTPTELLYVNEDSMPHNIAIYTDSSAAEPLFEGEIITGGSVLYEIPALEPGEYFFRCDLHPDMVGTVVVEG